MPDPGKTDLREIVYRAVESDELDYKAHQSWNKMTRPAKGKFVRHLAALANTRGGYLVVGVGEDANGSPSVYTGLTPEEANSFDPTAVGTFVNNCVEPPIDFTIERPVIDGRTYAVFLVRPFSSLPHVCCQSLETELQPGVFYIRTREASSRAAHRAFEVQTLIQRALRNQRELLGRMLRGILYENRSAAAETESLSGFEEEANSAAAYFRRRRPAPQEIRTLLLQFYVHPDRWTPQRFTAERLRATALEAWRPLMEQEVVRSGEVDSALVTNTSLRFLAADEPRMWQLFESGLFFFACRIPCPQDGRMELSEMVHMVQSAVPFAARLCSGLELEEDMMRLTLRMENIQGCSLAAGACAGPAFREPELAIELSRSAADLISGSESHAEQILRRLGEAFGLPDRVLRNIPGLLREGTTRK